MHLVFKNMLRRFCHFFKFALFSYLFSFGIILGDNLSGSCSDLAQQLQKVESQSEMLHRGAFGCKKSKSYQKGSVGELKHKHFWLPLVNILRHPSRVRKTLEIFFGGAALHWSWRIFAENLVGVLLNDFPSVFDLFFTAGLLKCNQTQHVLPFYHRRREMDFR